MTFLGEVPTNLYQENSTSDTGFPAPGTCLNFNSSVSPPVIHSETDEAITVFLIGGGFWVEGLNGDGATGQMIPVQVAFNAPDLTTTLDWTVDVVAYADDIFKQFGAFGFTGLRLHITGYYLATTVRAAG
jgi:hypothetical protein